MENENIVNDNDKNNSKIIKKLSIGYGNYKASKMIEIENINDVLKCNYQQLSGGIFANPKHKEPNKCCEISKSDYEDILKILEKIDFSEKASENDYYEGGDAGTLIVEYEDGSTQTKEFGIHMPKDVKELFKVMLKKCK